MTLIIASTAGKKEVWRRPQSSIARVNLLNDAEMGDSCNWPIGARLIGLHFRFVCGLAASRASPLIQAHSTWALTLTTSFTCIK